MKLESLGIALLALLMVVGAYALGYGLIVALMVWAWNTFLAGVLGLHTITFLQGIAMIVILSFIRGILSALFTKKEVKVEDES